MYFCLGKAEKKMIKRKIDNNIESFYKNHNKALLLTGARQTGKTFANSLQDRRASRILYGLKAEKKLPSSVADSCSP